MKNEPNNTHISIHMSSCGWKWTLTTTQPSQWLCVYTPSNICASVVSEDLRFAQTNLAYTWSQQHLRSGRVAATPLVEVTLCTVQVWKCRWTHHFKRFLPLQTKRNLVFDFFCAHPPSPRNLVRNTLLRWCTNIYHVSTITYTQIEHSSSLPSFLIPFARRTTQTCP